MYQIIFTKGDSEIVLKEEENLRSAKDEAAKFQKLPEYSSGLVTVEKKTNKGRRLL